MAAVSMSVASIGSSVIYSDTARTDTSLIPIVTTIRRDASTVLTTVTGGNSGITIYTTNGVVTTGSWAIGFAAISSIVIPGETVISTIGYETRVTTSSGRTAINTVPILTTFTIGGNTPTSIQIASSSVSSALPSLTSSVSSVLPLSTDSAFQLSSSARSSFATSTSSRSPETSSLSNEAVTGASESSSKNLSTGAIAGIAVGAVLGILIIVAALFCFARRKRRRAAKQTTQPSIVNDIIDKPELAGSLPNASTNKPVAGASTAYIKPELETTMTNHSSPILYGTLAHNSRHSPSMGGDRASNLMSREIYEAPAHSNTTSTTNSNAPLIPPPPQLTKADEKQVLQSEHYPQTYPEAFTRQPQSSINNPARPDNENTSPKYFVASPDPGSNTRPNSYAHPWRNESRTNPGQYVDPRAAAASSPDSLSRLRAEHEALLERIRIAEMKELERTNNA